jgi:hypothetical protein
MKKALSIMTVTVMALVVSSFQTFCATQNSKDSCADRQGAALAQYQDQQAKEKLALQKQQDAANAKTPQTKRR